MTNTEIIVSEVIAKGIYTEDQVNGFLAEGDLPVHTYREWQKLGYTVRKGQHAALETRLWKLRQHKKVDGASEEINKDEKTNYFLAKAFLFTLEQVAPTPT